MENRLKGRVSIHPDAFKFCVENACIHPTVDCFADSTNTLCRVFLDDALRHHWVGAVFWINPPWHLLPQVVAKICCEKPKCIVVTPVWPKTSWFNTLTKLCTSSFFIPPPEFIDSAGNDEPARDWFVCAFVFNM